MRPEGMPPASVAVEPGAGVSLRGTASRVALCTSVLPPTAKRIVFFDDGPAIEPPPRPANRSAPQPQSELPPHSPEDEAGLLGSLLQDPDRFSDVAGAFGGENPFYLENHRCVWAALQQLHRDGEAMDVGALAVKLRPAFSNAEKVVSDLMDASPGGSLVDSYLSPCRNAYLRRRILSAAADATQQARDPSAKPELVLSGWREAADYLAAASNGKASFTLRSPDELLAMTFDGSDRVLGDRLLAMGQSLVFAGQGGLGKSRMLLQLAVSTVCQRDFVGFETRGQNLKWLLLQCENSNRRLQADLAALRAWVGSEAWSAVNRQLTIHTLETDLDGFVNLANDAVCARIREAIRRAAPDFVVWDSLYNFAVGDLSSDADMAETLSRVSRLSRDGNPQRMIVVVHHALTGKAGASRAVGFDRTSFGRNSKVLFAWTRGQINVAPGGPEENPPLVLSCGKCSNGREFAPFAVRLNPATMIYEVAPDFDLAGWQAEVSGKADKEPLMTPERVRELCTPGIPKAELAHAITEDCGCYRGSAYRFIARAVKARTIKESKEHGTYFPR